MRCLAMAGHTARALSSSTGCGDAAHQLAARLSRGGRALANKPNVQEEENRTAWKTASCRPDDAENQFDAIFSQFFVKF